MSMESIVADQNEKFLRSMIYNRIPKPKIKKKFSQLEYRKEVITALTSGQCSMVEAIMRSHGSDPYKTADEVLGDLQLIACRIMNDFNEKIETRNFKPYSVEDFMTKGRFLQ